MKNKFINYLIILIISVLFFYLFLTFQITSDYFYTFFTIILLFIFFYIFLLTRSIIFKINVVFFSIIILICLLIFEFFSFFYTGKLFTTSKINYEYATNLKIDFDKRTKLEVITKLRKTEPNVFPTVYPVDWLKNGFFDEVNNKKIFPLSGVSYGESVYCNESGYWTVLPNDIYGFNNPNKAWSSKIDIMIVGDSFSRGACVHMEKTVAGNLRSDGINTVALSNGGGPLIELATVVEYVKHIKPKTLIWMFYEGNDYEDLHKEKQLEILLKYLNDEFEQKLIEKQYVIDDVVYNYIEDQEEIFRNESNKNIEMTVIDTIVDILFFRHSRFLIKTIFFNDQKYEYDKSTITKIFKKVKNITDSYKIDLYVVYIPAWERYYMGRNEDFLYKEEFIKDIDSIGIKIIDFDKELITFRDPKEFYVFGLNNHFNEKGYDLLTKTIKNYIEN